MLNPQDKFMNAIKPSSILFIFLFGLISSCVANTQETVHTGISNTSHNNEMGLPLFTINELQYKGAFLINVKTVHGDSDSMYASAAFEVSSEKSFFFGGRKNFILLSISERPPSPYQLLSI